METLTEEYYGPEPQFDQTIGYFNQLLEAHGTATLPGETGDDATRRLAIDPKGDDYRLKDIHLAHMPDGTVVVHETYNTYRFDPATSRATKTYFMHSLYGHGPETDPIETELDDAAQRELIVQVSDAMHAGKVVPHEPIFPRPTLRQAAASLASKLIRR